MIPTIQIVPDAPALFRAAAALFLETAQRAVSEHGSFSVALSGGSTPKGLFSMLVDDAGFFDQIPWRQIEFFWGDERHVPPDHPDSNFRMAQEALLSRAPIRDTQIRRIHAEYPDPKQAAGEYEATLRERFHVAAGEFPVIDLILLGMGPDGHTASLFPGTRALQERQRLVVSNWVGKFYADRITMTAPLLTNAGSVLFLVSGEDKAPALKGVLEGPEEPDQLPAQLLRPAGAKCRWLIDQAAAKLLSTEVYGSNS